MKSLLQSIPFDGKIEWIGRRPQKRGAVEAVQSARLTPEEGLLGDHYSGRSGKRQVTLIQAEHLPVVAAILRKEKADPALTRRNILVSGINLLALKGQRFRLGEALLEYTGECHPCSRMEENFGPGGYNAMRGHGGITARVLEGGTISVGDAVSLYISNENNE
ncbi:MAG: MOSC domain-containing protein [Phaeodactylibacter sp.]|nr:MOSC domain-containing protein [Phaeodactylibacter sp.]